jgi:hemerythrin
MQWDESLAIGIELIDAQHREWIRRVEDVSLAMYSAEGVRRLVETLDFLKDYTRFHFETEERFMADHQYPELDDHRRKHAELHETLARLEADLDEEGITAPLTGAVSTLLENWLIQHIRQVDQRFGAFLRDRGTKGTAGT